MDLAAYGDIVPTCTSYVIFESPCQSLVLPVMISTLIGLQPLLGTQVWMWFRPKGKGLDAAHDIRRVPLSQESSCMSFAQFLQVEQHPSSLITMQAGGCHGEHTTALLNQTLFAAHNNSW
jgi:hypothetical protein